MLPNAVVPGVLMEYSNSPNPLILSFEFNPTTISRTRSVNVQTGETPANRGGYSFADRKGAQRASSGITMDPETFSISILLDATDAMNLGVDPVAITQGVLPQMDILRTMVEPKARGSEGARVLASLDEGHKSAILNQEYASVILFIWGERVLPVFLTSVQFEEKAHLPTLVPYRAEVTLQMQVIESDNPFYKTEMLRQFKTASDYKPIGVVVR